MAITAADAESREETGLETGCTSNLTTTASARTSLHRREIAVCGTIGTCIRAVENFLMDDPTPHLRAHMTTRRAVTYGGLSCLLAAWLASAASTTFQPFDSVPRESARGTTGTSTDALAIEVQAHASRLRQRLQSAPTPQLPHRNPFAFQARPPQVVQPVRRAERVAPVEPPPPAEPRLSLIGIAEDQGPSGLIRTAIMADEAENLLMATVGHTVLGRYRVEAIGADAVELNDVNTNAVRRIGLR